MAAGNVGRRRWLVPLFGWPSTLLGRSSLLFHGNARTCTELHGYDLGQANAVIAAPCREQPSSSSSGKQPLRMPLTASRAAVPQKEDLFSLTASVARVDDGPRPHPWMSVFFRAFPWKSSLGIRREPYGSTEFPEDPEKHAKTDGHEVAGRTAPCRGCRGARVASSRPFACVIPEANVLGLRPAPNAFRPRLAAGERCSFSHSTRRFGC